MFTKLFFVLSLISFSFAGFNTCYNPDVTIYNQGISGSTYPGKLCNHQHCINTENHQIFFCYNYVVNVIVPCNSTTWDPISNFCGIVEVVNPGCTTKKCVDQTRMQFLDASQIWECVDPTGKSKLCGNFQSNEDELYFIADSLSFSLMFSLFGSPHPLGGKQCKLAYDAWENRPESMSFDLF